MLSYKMDFSSCDIMPGFGKSSHIYIYILICYNTAARGMTDIYARLPRACSARGRVRIYQLYPKQAVL